MKRVGLFLGILFVVLVGGFWAAGKSSFSDHTTSEPSIPPASITNVSYKMSGVIKAIDLTDPDHSRLIVVGESGEEKTVFLSTDTLLLLVEHSAEKVSLELSELKMGDVVDLDLELDEKTQEPLVQRLSVVVRVSAEPTPEEKALLEDPEFE